MKKLTKHNEWLVGMTHILAKHWFISTLIGVEFQFSDHSHLTQNLPTFTLLTMCSGSLDLWVIMVWKLKVLCTFSLDLLLVLICVCCVFCLSPPAIPAQDCSIVTLQAPTPVWTHIPAHFTLCLEESIL